ncbi:PREDICTED: uncharacterized protein LOC108612331 [Drosophila arizonae]|uniref:Uncharacterized protein LOC108612331 n=1 Tax=Drosophila arizonae TaxID=7263 RepID=A0ABM1P0G3_DROAR|nr:PREDICTED: uncharacterized protein LOC108612331 [Drosophila arizonae]
MLNECWPLLLLAMIALLAASPAKNRPLTIQIKNFTCVSMLPSLMPEFNCSSSKVRGQASMYVSLLVTQPVEELSLQVDFDIVKKDNSRISLMHAKLDGCQQFNSASKNKLLGEVYERIFENSNFPKACPFLANKVYTIRNYTITLDRIPMALPTLTFNFKLKLFRAKQLFGDVFLEASAKY